MDCVIAWAFYFSDRAVQPRAGFALTRTPCQPFQDGDGGCPVTLGGGGGGSS